MYSHQYTISEPNECHSPEQRDANISMFYPAAYYSLNICFYIYSLFSGNIEYETVATLYLTVIYCFHLAGS